MDLSNDDLRVPELGSRAVVSPLAGLLERRQRGDGDIEARGGMLLDDSPRGLRRWADNPDAAPRFDLAGPRKRLFFDPAETRVGIVTCGGLCPGLNDVIRGLVMVLYHRYGVRDIIGFRSGYLGITPDGPDPVPLTPAIVSGIHQHGGTMLGSSRGPQDPAAMLARLRQLKRNVLFVIGGDGTLRGGLAIDDAARAAGENLAVVGVPKTIDNDISFVEQSFGFHTAATKAVESISAAHTEALGAVNGVGIVKLMGRHSGFIAATASLASCEANYVLIPEVDFPLGGEQGLLEQLRHRLVQRGHAVIVVAEGAGQQHVPAAGVDASGNRRLGDVGPWLRDTIRDHMKTAGTPCEVKYIDPSYIIRSVPSNPHDSVYCFRLAAYSVHAAMAGFTRMVVGRWHGQFVHIPIPIAVGKRQQVDPQGDLWLTVLEATGQPRWCDTHHAVGG